MVILATALPEGSGACIMCSSLQRLSNDLREKSVRADQLSQQLKAKKADLDHALGARMEQARAEKDCREKLNYLQSEGAQTEQELRRLTSKATMKGIASVRAVLDEFRREGGASAAAVVNGYRGK